MKLPAVLLMAVYATAQVRNSGVVDSTVATVANLPAYKLGANDLIAVSVYDSPELTRTVRVGSDGGIDIPMLKNPVHAAGLLPAELERAIADALRENEILVRPVVTVTILQYNDRAVSVVGAVHKPVSFPVTGRLTLIDALAKAEGLTSDAGPELLLTVRAGDGSQKAEVRTISIRQLIDQADPALNAELTGGEEVRVPEARKVYVVGNVKKPGAYPLRDADGMTILKVLAVSEGLMPFAAKTAYIYRKTDAPDSREELAVDLNSIVKRKTPDVKLMADDVFYIPDNNARRNVAAVLDRAAGFGASTASGVLIWRH